MKLQLSCIALLPLGMSALKAADAETFGGKPPSAYLSAGSGVNGARRRRGQHRFDYRIMGRRKGCESIRLADNTERFQALANQHRNGAHVELSALPRLPSQPVPKTTVIWRSRPMRSPQPPHVAKLKVERK
jgi:hypothetical protein